MRGTLLSKSIITSRSENKVLLNWLNSKKDKSEFIESTLNAVRTGELRPATELEDEEQIKRDYLINRNKKLVKQCLRLDIQNRLLLVHDLKYSPDDAVKIAKGEKSIDEEDKIRCPDCTSWRSDSTRTNQAQVDSLISHLKEWHKRQPTEDEQVELLEIVAE